MHCIPKEWPANGMSLKFMFMVAWLTGSKASDRCSIEAMLSDDS
jgi:hypothetical protein